MTGCADFSHTKLLTNQHLCVIIAAVKGVSAVIDRFQSFVGGITDCYKYIQRIKAAEMTEWGLKGTHVMCLFFLRRHPDGLTAAELCRLCGEDKAAISRTLATLQERGYLAVGAHKYRAPLTLTAAGAAVATELDETICRWVGVGGLGLSDEQRAIFYHTLEHIAANLRQQLNDRVSGVT